MMQRIARRALLAAIALGVLAALAGSGYNALSIKYYRDRAGTPGKIYAVDGHPMHLYCTGQGSPTLVLESGLGDGFLSWARVQPSLSQVTTVCAYDRAGFGWSASQSGRRDANAIADQLHLLLSTAGVNKPVILMGHSIGGIYLRAYAKRFPAELAGLVFVDGATPLQNDRIPQTLLRLQEEDRRNMSWQKTLMALGWYRLRGDCDIDPTMPAAYVAWSKADACIPSQITAVEDVLDAERISGEQTLHAGPFTPLPILVLSRDPKSRPPNWPADVARDTAAVWDVMQEETKLLSSNSRRVIALRSDHYIQNDRPELVVAEVGNFIAEVRDRRRSDKNGTTTEK